MTNMNLEDKRVDFFTAKLAKEKGFKGFTTGYYYKDEGEVVCNPLYCYYSDGLNDNSFDNSLSCQAPTQSLLQKWLREVYNIHIELIIDGWQSDEKVSGEFLCYRAFIWQVGKPKPKVNEDLGAQKYEIILEIALVEALNLI